ncbi:hypothetical protein [Kitasatospora sp. GP82]|nr:hypothetical protein [Kitasatospora sp. GP82]MDH6128415.1 hypothetical protein [Kitasatospora sp. GP82]
MISPTEATLAAPAQHRAFAEGIPGAQLLELAAGRPAAAPYAA